VMNWRRFIDRMASLLPSRDDSIADWQGSGQGLAALRDFDRAYRRFGS
jgi:hypothetical protein